MQSSGGPSRRQLFRIGTSALAMARLAGAAPSGSRGGGDRVLVQLYLQGGNDSNNLIVPRESGAYAAYARARGGLAVPEADLIPVVATSGRAQVGFHPVAPELAELFERKALAVVANVEPVSEGERAWQYLPGGYAVPLWAARMAGIENVMTATGWMGLRSGIAAVTPDQPGREWDPEKVDAALAGAEEMRTVFPDNGLGRRLENAVRLIQAGTNLGAGRMVISCTLSGFDTHSDQAARQPALFRELSTALAAFYEATVEIGAARRVTLYTDTDGNRTLQVNERGGTDHALGGHQLVAGGAVLGGDFYGEMPSGALRSGDDISGKVAGGRRSGTSSTKRRCSSGSGWIRRGWLRCCGAPGKLCGSFRRRR
jgi:uncharacterized protein (DUF1501 family)